MGVKINELPMTHEEASFFFGREAADRLFNKDRKNSRVVNTVHAGKRLILFHDPRHENVIWRVEVPATKLELESSRKPDGIELLEILFFEGHFQQRPVEPVVEQFIHDHALTRV